MYAAGVVEGESSINMQPTRVCGGHMANKEIEQNEITEMLDNIQARDAIKVMGSFLQAR